MPIVDSQHDSTSGIDDDDEMIDLTGNDLPQYFLKQKEWRSSFCRCIHGVMNMEPEEEVSDDVCCLATGIHEILQIRFAAHFRLRNCEGKEKHFAFKWAKQNLPRVVAAMTYFGHIQKDIHKFQTNSNTTLLANPVDAGGSGNFMIATTGRYESCIGNYLYFDSVKMMWIRSGKVSGRNTNFKKRHEEHQRLSKNPKGTTMGFYSAGSAKKLGHFHFLCQYCGLAFSRDGCEELIEVGGNNSVLDWDEFTLAQLNKRVESRDECNLKDLQINMVAYLFELMSALCIGVSANVSESPGFENIAHTYRS